MQCHGCPNCNKDPSKPKAEQIINGAAYTLIWETVSEDAKELIAVLADEKNRELFYRKCVEYVAERERKR